jgi:hypothetical protein
MMRVTATLGAVIVTLGIAPLIAGGAQPPNSLALFRFNQQIDSYMALRQAVQDRVGVPSVSAGSTEIGVVEDALARGIREARPRAKAGDFFSADVGAEFRHRIAHAIESEGSLSFDVRRTVTGLCTPAVNGRFDMRFGGDIPAAVIDALPDLPWPLQYRFACRDLVLLDADAGLVVDVLPDALTVQ